MKHLFLLLLAANIGLFIWGYQREQAMEHAKPALRLDVGDIRLLSEQNNSLGLLEGMQEEAVSASERETDELTEMEPDSIEEMPEQEGIDAATEIAAEIEVEQQILPEDEQTTQVEVAEIRDVLLGDTGLAEDDRVGEEVKELQPGVATGSEQATETEQKPQVELAFKPETESMQFTCYRLGPIFDLTSAEGLSGHLMQLGFDAVMHNQSIKKTRGHWVMIPPQASYRDANQKLQELKKAGITDLWLFPRGEYKNAISLGLYSRIANAEAAQERTLKKGIATVVLPHQIKVDQFWLEFQSAKQLPVSKESRMALQEDYPDEKVAIEPCSAVVTE